jgi:hypothetical protein
MSNTIPYDQCMSMTVRELRQTPQYKNLTPLGIRNISGHYRYGNKSTMRKEDLCRALSNPAAYQRHIKKLKDEKQKAGPRKRETRKGQCNGPRRQPPCTDPVYRHLGYTTTGRQCCYKREMTEKTKNKRMRRSVSKSK